METLARTLAITEAIEDCNSTDAQEIRGHEDTLIFEEGYLLLFAAITDNVRVKTIAKTSFLYIKIIIIKKYHKNVYRVSEFRIFQIFCNETQVLV